MVRLFQFFKNASNNLLVVKVAVDAPLDAIAGNSAVVEEFVRALEGEDVLVRKEVEY